MDQPKISGPSNYPIEHLLAVFWPRPDSFRMPPSWPDACKKVAATGLETERTSAIVNEKKGREGPAPTKKGLPAHCKASGARDR